MTGPATNSSRRDFLGNAQKAAFRAAMKTALSGGAPGEYEPLDWLHTTTPREWRFGGEKISFHWEEPSDANPMRV
jgi:hypothetical protein